MINRGDPRDPSHLAEWRYTYGLAQTKYKQGIIGRVEAGDILARLGFRGEAQKIELLVWDKLRQDYRKGISSESI